MRSYEIPRNVKGEGRILYIFSTKGLIYTAIGAASGAIFYFIFRLIGLTYVGIIITLFFALVGFIIGTLKMPKIEAFEVTKKTGGENIDDIIKRIIKFKKNKAKIYVNIKEEK